MPTMTDTLLRPDTDGFNHLLLALVKTRSVIAENGTMDLMGRPSKALGLKGLAPWVADDRTVTLLSDLANGTRTCDSMLWLNLAHMVKQSPAWGIGLAVREVQMPTPSQVLQQIAPRP